eukprot:Sspe_Gene.732::Locus_249_Transcript_1_1_Confidence_1.000_Length_7732::g.732::m.732
MSFRGEAEPSIKTPPALLPKSASRLAAPLDHRDLARHPDALACTADIPNCFRIVVITHRTVLLDGAGAQRIIPLDVRSGRVAHPHLVALALRGARVVGTEVPSNALSSFAHVVAGPRVAVVALGVIREVLKHALPCHCIARPCLARHFRDADHILAQVDTLAHPVLACVLHCVREPVIALRPVLLRNGGQALSCQVVALGDFVAYITPSALLPFAEVLACAGSVEACVVDSRDHTIIALLPIRGRGRGAHPGEGVAGTRFMAFTHRRAHDTLALVLTTALPIEAHVMHCAVVAVVTRGLVCLLGLDAVPGVDVAPSLKVAVVPRCAGLPEALVNSHTGTVLARILDRVVLPVIAGRPVGLGGGRAQPGEVVALPRGLTRVHRHTGYVRTEIGTNALPTQAPVTDGFILPVIAPRLVRKVHLHALVLLLVAVPLPARAGRRALFPTAGGLAFALPHHALVEYRSIIAVIARRTVGLGRGGTRPVVALSRIVALVDRLARHTNAQVDSRAHTPPLHWSWTVLLFPSSHAVPLGLMGSLHTPVCTSHTPMAWQASFALQMTPLHLSTPLHTPSEHLSSTVRGLPSLHAVPSFFFGVVQFPVR